MLLEDTPKPALKRQRRFHARRSRLDPTAFVGSGRLPLLDYKLALVPSRDEQIETKGWNPGLNRKWKHGSQKNCLRALCPPFPSNVHHVSAAFSRIFSQPSCTVGRSWRTEPPVFIPKQVYLRDEGSGTLRQHSLGYMSILP